MTDLSKKSCVVVDHGLFLEVAHRLARDFGTVYYCDPSHEEAFARIDHAVIGDGFDNIRRVEEVWDVIDKVDICVFPDVHHGAMQQHIASMDIPVWGGRRADELEVKKVLFRAIMRQLGMAVPEYTVMIGLESLREHCRNPKNDDQWIKVSPQFRGNRETFHHDNYAASRSILDQMGVDFGIVQDVLRFIAEKPIEADFESGLDTYCVDGKHPSVVLQAYERKDRCCVGAVQNYADAPDQLTEISDTLWPLLKGYGARQFVSTEVKIDGSGNAVLLEPTVRMASPAGEPQLELYGNFSQIIYEGAHGRLVEPELTGRFYFQCMIKHKGDAKQWRSIRIPKEVRDSVKIYSCCQVGNQLGICPGEPIIGSVIGVGDNPTQALMDAKEIAECLKDEPVEIQIEDFAETIAQIESAEEEGIPFSEEDMPDPSDVIGQA